MLLVSFFLTRLTGCKAVNTALDANELSVAMHLEQQLIEGISVPSSGGGHNLKDVHFSGFCDAQGFYYGSPLSGTMDRLRFAEQRPPAGVLVEATGGFLLLYVASSRVQGYIAGLTSQNQDGVGSAPKAVRSPDHIEGIVRVHFSDAANNNNCDPSSMGQLVKARD